MIPERDLVCRVGAALDFDDYPRRQLRERSLHRRETRSACVRNRIAKERHWPARALELHQRLSDQSFNFRNASEGRNNSALSTFGYFNKRYGPRHRPSTLATSAELRGVERVLLVELLRRYGAVHELRGGLIPARSLLHRFPESHPKMSPLSQDGKPGHR